VPTLNILLQAAQETATTDRFTEGVIVGITAGLAAAALLFSMLVLPRLVTSLFDDMFLPLMMLRPLNLPQPPVQDEDIELLVHVIEEEQRFIHRVIVGLILGILVAAFITVVTLGIVRLNSRWRNNA